MRLALWSVILASIAVAIALFAGGSDGLVVVAAFGKRIDLSLNLAGVLLLAGYAGF